jgi:hypothetical protein
VSDRPTDRPPRGRRRGVDADEPLSRRFRDAADAVVRRVAAGVQEAVARHLDADAEGLRGELLGLGHDLYNEGVRNARRVDRAGVAAYLGALGARGAPPSGVTAAELVAALRRAGFDASEAEARRLAEELGLPLVEAGDGPEV